MYDYIRNYPYDAEPGWSEELHGVCHDESNWYFTQNGNLWKIPLKFNLKEKCKTANTSKGIFRKTIGKELGDFDYYKGYLFIPITTNSSTYISVYNAADLSYVTKQSIKKFGNSYNNITWCAINPKDGRLYTSDRDIRSEFYEYTSPIMVYDINLDNIRNSTASFLSYKTYIVPYSENGKSLARDYVQGGCFDNSNHLHITNGHYTIKGGSYNYANEKGGISVFTIPDLDSKPRYEVRRISSSNQAKGFCFQFDGTGEEPRGITYWDVSGKSVGGEVCGVLHAIMIDNSGVGDDDLYFKHYSKNNSFVEPKYFATSGIIKRGVIITAVGLDEKGNAMTLAEADRRDDNRQLMQGLFEKRGIDLTVIANYKISEIKKLIRSVFCDAKNTDWSYTYINCHGGIGFVHLGYNGKAYSENLEHEVEISYRDLSSVYSGIMGKQIFLLDTCHAGSADALYGSNRFILCSTVCDQTAVGDNVFGGWATRYWSAGAGNDFIAGAKDDLEADSSYDGKVSLKELCTYTNNKLCAYSRNQLCVTYPVNSPEVIFE